MPKEVNDLLSLAIIVLAVMLAVPIAAFFQMPRWLWIGITALASWAEWTWMAALLLPYWGEESFSILVFVNFLSWLVVTTYLWFSNYQTRPWPITLGLPFVYFGTVFLGLVVSDMTGLISQ